MNQDEFEEAQTQREQFLRPDSYLPTRHRPHVRVANQVPLGYPVSAPPTPFPFPPYDPVQTSMVASIARVMDEGGVGAIESPTGTGKTLCALAAVLGRYEYIRQQRGAVPDPSVFRVFYGCRTHAQVGQVVDELTKLPRPPGFTVSVMGSRKQLCLIHDVRTSDEPKHACLRLQHGNTRYEYSAEDVVVRQHGNTRCEYSTEDVVVRRACSDLRCERDDYAYPDIEDIAEAGKARGVCPYSLARAYSAHSAHLIIAPYNYILNSHTFSIAGSCIIIDEAHNLPGALTDTLKVEITLERLISIEQIAADAIRIIDESDFNSVNRQTNSPTVPSPEHCQEIQYGLSGIQSMLKDVTDQRTTVGADGQPGTSRKGLGEYFISHLKNHLATAKLDWFTGRKVSTVLDANEFIETLKPIIQESNEYASVLLHYERDFVTLFPNLQTSSVIKFARKIQTFNKMMQCDPDTLVHFVGTENNASGISPTLSDLRVMGVSAFATAFRSKLEMACVRPAHAFERLRSPEKMTYEHCQAMRRFGPAFGNPNVRPQPFYRTYTSSPDEADNNDEPTENANEPSEEGVQMGMPPISIILISGTLSPLDAFCKELCHDWLVQHSTTQIVPDAQLMIRSIPHYNDNNGLPTIISSAYKNRDDVDGVVALGNLIRDATSAVSGGTLLVFPSYSQFYSRMRVWRDTGMVINNMFGQVPIFFESKDELLDTTLANYRSIIANDRSAILCVICRGRLSEGINLKDRQSRLVILCGIPYLPFSDPIINATMNYYNKNAGITGMNGQDWYESMAWRAVNQALGRVVRHHKDYGAVLLADERMHKAVQENRANTLSQWVLRLAKPYIEDGTLVQQLRAFYRHNEERERADAFASTRSRTVAPADAPALVYSDDDDMRITQMAFMLQSQAGSATQVAPSHRSFARLTQLLTQNPDICIALRECLESSEVAGPFTTAGLLLDIIRTQASPDDDS